MSGKGFNLFRGSQLAARSALECRSMQMRTFSSSLSRQKTSVVPTFKPTSSPELDNLLTTVREKIIIPSYLSEKQRDTIFHVKHKKTLESEPVTATIGEEEFRLQYIDPKNDIPSTRESLKKILGLMKKRPDWENLIGLLTGLYNSRAQYKKAFLTEISIRALGNAGQQDILLECLRRASETGIRLRRPSASIVTMNAMLSKAVDSEWSAGETEKALQWAEQVVDLMEDPKHSGSDASPLFDSRRRPEVIGMVLQLAAIRAQKYQGGKDIDGKVEKYAKRVLGCFDNRPSMEDWLNNKNADMTKNANRINFKHNELLCHRIPLLSGMKVAQEVLGADSEVSVQLKEKSEVLEKEVSTSYNALAGTEWAEERPRTGIAMYERHLKA